MCRNIHRSLVDGAEFFVFAQHPDFLFDGPSLAKYGFTCEAIGGESESGPRVKITALLDPPISFICTPPRREVYENSLRAAGFTELNWVPLAISDAGVREYGKDFWDDYAANPALVMLRCRA
ncbi:hypothetical protein ABZ826_27770 [Streptomyces sp. NPDC047515]|uniref:hypothetical protein n=1 Tax=Streptomyces sp. NPDC047515 TaxID=3155380 RepID=UPI00340E8116